MQDPAPQMAQFREWMKALERTVDGLVRQTEESLPRLEDEVTLRRQAERELRQQVEELRRRARRVEGPVRRIEGEALASPENDDRGAE